MSEKKLWNELRSGNKSALEQIYTSNFDDLFAYGKKFSSDISIIEDCIQELFIDLWSKRSSLSETDKIKPYLYVSLRRKIIALIKKSRNLTGVELEDKHFEASLSIEDLLISEELSQEKKDKIKSAFESLSDRQKEILYLKFYSQFDYEAISEIMDMNYQSARNLVSRAIAKLSKVLGTASTIILLSMIK